MTEYTIHTGRITKKITERSIDNALRRFFSDVKAKDFGILVSVEYKVGREEETKLAPIESCLQKLGIYSKFEKEIKELFANKKSSRKGVIDYD